MENGDRVTSMPAAAATKARTAPVEATAVVREQDRLMPIANVIRIMRRVLPPHAKI
jgi:histone H3/H4